MYMIFEQLMKERGITPYRVWKDTGVAQSTLSRWKQTGILNSADTLKTLADYFGVTVEFLMGREEQKNNPAETDRVYNAQRDALRDEIMKYVDQLTDDRKKIVLAQIKALTQVDE